MMKRQRNGVGFKLLNYYKIQKELIYAYIDYKSLIFGSNDLLYKAKFSIFIDHFMIDNYLCQANNKSS